MMRDACGREIDYLRLSVTDRCNLRCRYCMPREVAPVPHEEILRDGEIERLCRIAAGLGVRNIKITGGEPLVRGGCANLISTLKKLPGIEHVTLTTNGVLLAGQLEQLRQAGVDAINVSLDTLDAARYARITGFDFLPRVLRGIQAAVKAGIRTKINCVLLPSCCEEVKDLASLAARWPVDVRFIEIMPIGNGRDFASYPIEELLPRLKERWPELKPSADRRGFGPARYFTAPQLKGAIGIIDAVSHSFCDRCNRVRLTSEGYWKLCLCYEDGVDLRAPLRAGASDETLREAMQSATYQKPARHHFELRPGQTRGMWQIGG